MEPLVVAIPGDGGRAGPLARQIGGEVAETEIRSFPDGETYVRIKTPVKDREVLIVASLDRPDAAFMRTYFAAETARDLGADAVGLVAPYMPYLRQDARFRDGEGVTSRYFSALVSETFDWLVTVDPHLHRLGDLAEIYSVPVEVVSAAGPIADWIAEHVDDPVLVGPDEESRQWVSAVAERRDFPSLILEKTRRGDYDVEIRDGDLGEIADHDPVVVDDIISTGRTMVEAARRLVEGGFDAPVCLGIHGLFADDALSALREVGVERIATTDTVPHDTNAIEVTGPIVEGSRRMIGGDTTSISVASGCSGSG